MSKEEKPTPEIEMVLKAVAVSMVEHSRENMIILVKTVLASIGPGGSEILLGRMNGGALVEFGRTLSDKWDNTNALEAARLAAQREMLAQIFTSLINIAVGRLIAESQ